jgi:hypothetical protein
LVKTGETSGGINTPVGGTGFMSTMVGTTVTGGNNLLYPNQLTLLGGELHPIEEP